LFVHSSIFLLETAQRAVAVVAVDMLATPDCSVPIRLVRDKEVWIRISLLEFLG
jgi:hypothetical protein